VYNEGGVDAGWAGTRRTRSCFSKFGTILIESQRKIGEPHGKNKASTKGVTPGLADVNGIVSPACLSNFINTMSFTDGTPLFHVMEDSIHV
jgi:hypothetical protein